MTTILCLAKNSNKHMRTDALTWFSSSSALKGIKSNSSWCRECWVYIRWWCGQMGCTLMLCAKKFYEPSILVLCIITILIITPSPALKTRSSFSQAALYEHFQNLQKQTFSSVESKLQSENIKRNGTAVHHKFFLASQVFCIRSFFASEVRE